MTRENRKNHAKGPRKPIDKILSDRLYNQALKFVCPFVITDLIGVAAVPELNDVAQRWLDELVQRGELKRTKQPRQTFYEWIN